ncbi:MAG: cytochrome P450 [Myxococcota bacterium]|jgi:cytochrome P450
MTSASEPSHTTDPLLTDEYFENPAAVTAMLRRTDPVHYIEPLDAWMITRYDDIRELFIDPRVSNDRRYFSHYQPAPEGSQLRWMSEHNFFSAPEDEHQRMRNLVSKTMTPRGVKRMEAQIRDVVGQFADKLRGRTGTVDMVEAFCSPIPNTVISRLTGIPAKEDDEVRFRELAREVISGISPLLDDEGRQVAENAVIELSSWVGELAKERSALPREDMISDLLAKHGDEGAATVDEIILVIAGLVAAGSETTAMGTTMGLRSLFKNPDQLAMLREDRSLMPNAVRELLRYDFGSAGLPRYAVEDFELRGHKIRKGQPLFLSFTGAHRDPEVFDNPDQLDLKRDTRELTIFGRGAHYCIGANLAQLEMGIMLNAALDVIPEGATLVEDEIEWMRRAMFARVETLPIDFGS